MKQLKRRHVTLIEMMIVMFLIALITGVIAYNSRGSLDEGKSFKTKMAIEKIEAILNLKVAEDPSLLDSIGSNWEQIIETSPLAQNAKNLITDGWGKKFIVTSDNNGIHVESQALLDHESKKGKIR